MLELPQMDKEKVLNLAKLARIDISETEADDLSREFGAILNYVGEVKEANLGSQAKVTEGQTLQNVFREDDEPHESGIYTKDLLAEAPERESSFFKVKKIL